MTRVVPISLSNILIIIVYYVIIRLSNSSKPLVLHIKLGITADLVDQIEDEAKAMDAGTEHCKYVLYFFKFD